MTADAIAGVEEQCKRVGIDYYISKPYEPEQFVATIWNVLKPLNEEREKTKLEQAATLEIPMMEDATLDENNGIRRIGNNKDLYLIVINEYYRENKDVLGILTSNVNEGHYQDAIQIVHKIKSSSGNIGAKRLHTVASELQKALAGEDGKEILRLLEQFHIAFNQLFDELSRKISDTVHTENVAWIEKVKTF